MSGIPIGVDLDGEGAHPAAWRAAAHAPVELFAPETIARRIGDADASGLAFAIFPDRAQTLHPRGVVARLDAVETATFAAAASTRIGLIPGRTPCTPSPITSPTS